MEGGMSDLFQEEVAYEIETFAINDVTFKLKVIEAQNGQVASCLSQV